MRAPDRDNETWHVASSHESSKAKSIIAQDCLYSGLLLKDRYVVERELGRGGIGVVYFGRDQQLLAKPVVIKFLLDSSAEKNWSKKKFRQEIEALARLDHPAVIGILDTGETPDGTPFLVMQFIEGANLRAVLESEQISFRRIANIMQQIGQAISAAHDKGIYHLDLKPENVMLQSLGEGHEQVKVIDFGIARVKDSQVTANNETSGVFGTIAYMAPEQLLGRPSASSDIYAMGIIAYELITGERPFKPESPFQLLEMERARVCTKPQDVRLELPTTAQDVILKALSFDPQDRWSRAREFGDELAKALTNNNAPNRSVEQERSARQFFSTIGVADAVRDQKQAISFPTGTVTFLFTDIEGSTRLWEEYPEEMKIALARHDRLLRESVETKRGVVFKTVGDAFCVAFAEAPNAVAAALAGQRALQREDWPIGPIAVRMAVHTGTAELRGEDYFGPTLNRVARLLSVGHGGQTLLSQPTWLLVRSTLPEHTIVHDLGEHRLKDLHQSERIFQLVSTDLLGNFPPLKTLENRANNLPLQPTKLIGREVELAALEKLLRDVADARTEDSVPVRLLTITGPGGTGKTRLALELLGGLIDEFENGVFLVSLASIKDPSLVVSAIAQTLGVKEVGGSPLFRNLKNFLADKQLLLLLDNFEHLLSSAPIVSELLADCPRLKVLVTSRAALHLRGEFEFPLSPLTLPDPKRPQTLEVLSQSPAIALFIQRAQAVKPDFLITPDNALAITQICARLDGLPLAIELAAARVKLLPPKAMLRRLENRLKVLTDGARDLPPRQQTMRSAIAWSYDLLTGSEQELFRRLSVFVGGATLDAIEPVCQQNGSLELDILDEMSSLVDKSLIRQDEQPEGEPRFTMLETIREYGLECLGAGGQLAETQNAHANFFLNVAEAAEPELTGPNQAELFDRLEREHDNLRAALGWAKETAHIDLGLQLSGALWRFWKGRGHLSEGRAWLKTLLSAADEHENSGARAKALRAQAILERMQGEYDTARSLLEESLSLYRALGDKHGIALSLDSLGTVLLGQDNYDRAARLLQESLALRRDLRDQLGIANSLSNLAIVMVTYQQGDCNQARRLCEESLALYSELQCEWGIATSLNNLGAIANQQGDHQAAKEFFVQGLTLFERLGDKAHVAICLEGLAGVACAQKDLQRAARLLGASKAFSDASNTPLPIYMRTEHECSLEALRAGLNEPIFTVAWAEGEAMSMAEAVIFASQTISQRNPLISGA